MFIYKGFLEKIYLLLILYKYICLPAWVYVYHMHSRGPKDHRVLDPLELELEAIVSCLIQVLEAKSRPPASATNPFTCWVNFPVPKGFWIEMYPAPIGNFCLQ